MSKPTADDLTVLEQAMRLAAIKMRESLAARWPEGSKIQVFLNSKQHTPSEAEVFNHDGWRASVRVRLTKPNRYGRQHVVDVHWFRCV